MAFSITPRWRSVCACEAEINLNRRLCPDVYLGLGSVIEVDGQIGFSGGHGQEMKVLDYGVWMKRLPADRMLDELVRQKSVTEAMIDRVAARLAAFHRTARRGADVNVYGSPAEIRHNWEENFAQTEAYIGRTLSTASFAAIRQWVAGWIDQAQELLLTRMHGGWVLDGHGDVRCESIWMQIGKSIHDNAANLNRKPIPRQPGIWHSTLVPASPRLATRRPPGYAKLTAQTGEDCNEDAAG